MRLSDFQDEKAIEVIGKLLPPIVRIAQRKENAEARDGSMASFAAAMLQNNAADVKEMLAVLNDEDPASYRCNAATVLRDVMVMISDPELLALFGLRSESTASSGSASENTEAPDK